MKGASKGSSGKGAAPTSTSGPRYAPLADAHVRVHQRLQHETLAFRASDHATTPQTDKTASKPATVAGNSWAERARAMARLAHARLFGTYPSLSPEGTASVTSVSLQRLQVENPRPLGAMTPAPTRVAPAPTASPTPVHHGIVRADIATLGEASSQAVRTPVPAAAQKAAAAQALTPSTEARISAVHDQFVAAAKRGEMAKAPASKPGRTLDEHLKAKSTSPQSAKGVQSPKGKVTDKSAAQDVEPEMGS